MGQRDARIKWWNPQLRDEGSFSKQKWRKSGMEDRSGERGGERLGGEDGGKTVGYMLNK